MDKDEIQSHLETLAEDFALDVTARQIKKFVNLTLELRQEADITFDEILAEFQSITPADEDDWLEFLEEVSDFVFDLINEQYDEETDEDNEE